MREVILSRLEEIEKQYDVRILLAVESGSRAWGFESPDSDYDVRFIYARRQLDYLKLEGIRDAIELPIDGVLDMNGWDITKALRLLYKSSPTLFEWFSSPIIYRKDSDFIIKIEPVLTESFSLKRGLYHYLSMEKSNYNEFLQGDVVRIKKYFYVLRPILACRWILDKEVPPPMRFKDLAAAELPAELQSKVDHLLDCKMNSPEIKMIFRVDAINEFLEDSIKETHSRVAALHETSEKSWEALNSIFLSTIAE